MKVTTATLPVLLLYLSLFGCAAKNPHGANSPPPAPSEILPALIERVRGSVVGVGVEMEGRLSSPLQNGMADCFKDRLCVLGSGSFVDSAGDIATAAHVADAIDQVIHELEIRGARGHALLFVEVPNRENENIRYCTNCTIAHNILSFPIAGFAKDDSHDVALMSSDPGLFDTVEHVSGNLGMPIPTHPVSIDSKRPVDGQAIFASGYPLFSMQLVSTSGAVASAWGTENLQQAQRKHIQDSSDIYRLDLRSNPGNSGCPLFSEASGSVIGIVIEVSQNIGGWTATAIPSKYLIDLMKVNHRVWNSTGSGR